MKLIRKLTGLALAVITAITAATPVYADWQVIDGKTYYYRNNNSEKVTGWKTIDGKLYYFSKESGEMVTENTIIGGARYIFSADGVCKGRYTGWTKSSKGKRYWKDGTLVTNKRLIDKDGNRFYADGSGYVTVDMSNSEKNGTLRARYLNSSAETSFFKDYKITRLFKSCDVKEKILTVVDNEMLIIPSGVTVRLYNGAQADGAICIEKGGKLILAEGTLSVTSGGSLFSDGSVYIKKKGCLSVKNGGELFVGKSGKLKISDEENLKLAEASNAVCLGSTDSENKKIGKKAIAAYVTADNSTAIADDPEALLPVEADYCTDFTFEIGIGTTSVTFVFDSGAVFKVLKQRDKFAFIGSCCTAMLGMYSRSNGRDYGIIYEIEDKDYIYDMETGGFAVFLNEDGSFTMADDEQQSGAEESLTVIDKTDALRTVNLNNCRSLGSPFDYVLAQNDASVNAHLQAYLLPEGAVVVLQRAKDIEKTAEDRLYYAYLLKPVD